MVPSVTSPLRSRVGDHQLCPNHRFARACLSLLELRLSVLLGLRWSLRRRPWVVFPGRPQGSDLIWRCRVNAVSCLFSL